MAAKCGWSGRTIPAGKPVRRLLLPLAALALLAGCAPTLESRHLGPQNLIQNKIERHYRDHAKEEGGRCSRPFIDAITKVAVIEDTPERWVADVRYRYIDRLRDEDVGSDRRICRGFASRTFTLVPKDGELAVAEMSGQACRGSRFTLSAALGLEKRKRTCP